MPRCFAACMRAGYPPPAFYVAAALSARQRPAGGLGRDGRAILLAELASHSAIVDAFSNLPVGERYRQAKPWYCL